MRHSSLYSYWHKRIYVFLQPVLINIQMLTTFHVRFSISLAYHSTPVSITIFPYASAMQGVTSI